MANVKITELTAATALAGTDVLPIVDVGADATKKVSVSDLLRNLPDGTASAPALAFADDQNTGVLSPGNNSLAFATSGTQRLVIDSSGDILAKTNNARIGSDVGSVEYGTSTNNSVRFYSNNTERLRIDGAGRLMLGTTTTGVGDADEFTVAGSGNIGITIRSGTTSSGNIFFSDATSGTDEYDGYIQYRHNDRALRFATAATERLRINSSGNVGIGTSSPSAPLHIDNPADTSITQILETGNAQVGLVLRNSTSTGNNIQLNATGNDFRILTSASERLRIDSSGRLLVGTTTDASPFSWGLGAQIGGTSTNAGLSIRRDQNSSGGALLMFSKSRGSLNGNTVVQSGDQIGGIYFNAADGTDTNNIAAQIAGEVDGTPGTDDMPGRLIFKTTADGANSPTEAMRIDSSQRVTVKAGAVAEIDTLTSGTTITPDFAASCNFTVTLGHNATIANPSNLTAGQCGSIFLVQDGTGSRTAAFGSYWDFAGGSAPTLTTAGGSVDRVDYIVRSSTSIHAVATLNYS